ncbi:VOC family protein [Ruminiclostridium cellobioparum]|uniref:VOC family protein n=1 Tax=Ruminiclostridium cellobioparum TaxID=29355 RepID=UPI0004887974|nr:VOC family protein [Ruminiclostridium cellobioparum]
MLGHYLMFNRNCAEALLVYEKAFDAKITEMQKYGDMPPNPNFPVPEENKELVLHSRIQLDGGEIMCADASERGEAGNNMYVSITTKDAALIQRAWNILKQDGEIYMELTESFFAVLHGSLRDRFGINWMFTAIK